MSQQQTGFKDPTSLTNWTAWALYAQIAVAFFSLIFGALEFQIVGDITNGNFASESAAINAIEINDSRKSLLNIIHFFVFLVSAILILTWIYRANYNARQLGANGMSFTPGWSIGWYFIPFLQLWKPYQAMKEIWQASATPQNWSGQPVTSLVHWWWGLFLTSNFLASRGFQSSLKMKEISDYLPVNILYILSDLTTIPLCLILIVIINKVHENQMANAGLNKNEKQVLNVIKADPEKDRFYEVAWNEFEIKRIDKEIWARVYSESEGNREKAKARYITERVKQLREKAQSKQQAQSAAWRQELQGDSLNSSPKSPSITSAAPPFSRPAGVTLLVIIFSLIGLGIVLLKNTSIQTPQTLAETQKTYKREDYRRTFSELSRLAESGSSDAQVLLGEMYQKGQGVAQDYSQAEYWYRKAANQGNGSAQEMIMMLRHSEAAHRKNAQRTAQ